MYSEQMAKVFHGGVSVFGAGLVVNPDLPYLGASPDGKVINHDLDWLMPYGLLEIKCPYNQRNPTLETVFLDDKCYIKYIDGKCYLDKTKLLGKAYYYQNEGQLSLSGLPWCDLAIYLQTHCHILLHCY